MDTNRDVSVSQTGCLTFAKRASGRLVGLFLGVMTVFLFAQVASAVTYAMEGQSKGSSIWDAHNISGWSELECIPTHVDVTGGPVSNLVITVNFPRDNGTTPGIEDLYNWAGTSNVVFLSQPTLTVFTGSTWTYTMTVSITNSAEADITFCARLAAGSHNFPGSSLHLTGNAGSTGLGPLQISKPGAGTGNPDLSIITTGPAFINAGSFVTYTLTYSNTTTSAAGGVQITDYLPTNAVFVSCSGGCAGTTNNSTIVWDLGLLTNGASGFVSYTMFVSSNTPDASSVVNTAVILTADNDSNSANNTSTVTSTVTSGCVAASIGAQPVSIVVCPGTAATVSVGANGTVPYSYQWRKNGAKIGGATGSAYTIASVSAADVGSYSVIVTNGCGSVTSSVATVTLNPATTASALTNETACSGDNVIFSTTASGTGPFTYQWQKNGSNLAIETNSTLTLTNVSLSDAATYSVVVTGTSSCNAVTNSATLAVNVLTTATALADQTVCAGQNAAFSTVATSAGPIAYQWSKDGQNLVGQTNSSYTITEVSTNDAGVYRVVVSGGCNAVTNSATLGVGTLAATPLSNISTCQGQPVIFSTVASGRGPFSYVWNKNGSAIPNATNSSYTIAIPQTTDAGTYSVVVVGSSCNAVTNSATLAVNALTTATALGDQTVCAGQSATFSTVATSAGPIAYQWSKDGQNLVGQTNSSYTIVLANTNDAGNYSVVVSGGCNAVTNSATLSVATVAATPLSNVSTCQGQPVTFSTVASGSGPFNYVWNKNGSVIPNATNSSYTIAIPQTTDAGTYSVIVSTSCISVTNSATLSVGQPITASALVPITRCPGQSATFSTAVGGSGPFVFVWKRNGQVLAGQTSSSITLNPLSNTNSGTYSVEVTGSCNSVTNSATLTVRTNATTTALGNYSVCAGQSVTFTTTASGTPPFSYRWRMNNILISGATASSYTVASANATNAGTYSVEVTGSCNTATNFGSLTIAPATTITPLVDQYVCASDTNVITFSATASGGAPFTYTWSTNGTVVAGQTSNVLTLTNVPPSTNAYTIAVTVTGGCGSASRSAQLMVYQTKVVTGAITFTSDQGIAINDNQPATPYPANISVHCIPGLPKKVRVTLLGVSHSYPSDINAMVVSPLGTALPLMVQCGGGNPISSVTLTFDDDASSMLPHNGQIISGSYKPTSYLPNPQFPVPATAPNTNSLSSFANQDPSGTWSLYVLDDQILDGGSMNGGWALTLVYGDETPSKFINTVYPGGDTFQTTLVGPAGLVHIVQSSPDMVNWSSIATNTLPTGSFPLTLPISPNGTNLFYRAIRPF